MLMIPPNYYEQDIVIISHTILRDLNLPNVKNNEKRCVDTNFMLKNIIFEIRRLWKAYLPILEGQKEVRQSNTRLLST